MGSRGAVRLAFALFAAAAALLVLSPPAAAQTGPSWPMFRGGPEHTAQISGEAPAELALQYSAPVGSGLPTPPVSSGDRIFVGSADGSVYCFLESNGTEAWRFAVGAPVRSVPALYGDRVFAVSENGRLCALSAASGELVWELRLPRNGSFLAPLTAAGSSLIVADDRGGLHCVGIENGGRLLWSASAGGRVLGGVTVGGGLAFAPLESGSLTALYLSNGSEAWASSEGSGSAGGFTPAFKDGRVFIGTRGRTTLCLDALTGAAMWSINTKSAVSTSPALDDARLFIGMESGVVAALAQSDGREVWSRDAGSKVVSSPVVLGDAVLVGTEDGRLVCLSASTGEELWSGPLGATPTASPALRRGLVLVTTVNGALTVFGSAGVVRPLARLEASPLRASVGDVVRFYAMKSSHPANLPLTSFSFDFGDGASTGWVTSDTVEHAYGAKGNYTVRLTVRAGDSSESAPAELVLEVFNIRPNVSLSLPPEARAGASVLLGAEASDPDGRIELYELDFEGDGAYDWLGQTLPAGLSHIYATSGTYAPALRATDDNGTSSVAIGALVVRAPPPTPSAPSLLAQPAAVASISLGALALAGAGVSVTEFGKYRLLLLFFVPLYVRLKKDEVLDNYVRGKIHGYIIANPGDHYNSIRDALELSNGLVAHHLHTLEREGLIHSVRDGMYRRFFPASARLPPEDEGHFNIQKRILSVIRSNPGISQKEIAQLVGVSSPTVNYHVSVLASARMIRVEKLGRRTRCFATELGGT
ncbi:MAG: outer membrane protein assembly factor BamB family protein [Thermoplasmatota archaeon]